MSNRKWTSKSPVTDQYLRSNGLRRKNVAKDGCCLFRAVADQVYLSQTMHWELRRMCADYIKNNPSKFESFMTISLKEYCWKLTNSMLWGGEPELVALSELLNKTIVVYQEQENEMTHQMFTPTTSKTVTGTELRKNKPEILLLFSGNNHYDILWEQSEDTSSSICQSVLYELLMDSVLKTNMSARDKRDAFYMKAPDLSTRSLHQPRPHYLLNRHPLDVLRGLSLWFYLNIPYNVCRREKESREKMDRRLALTLQYTVGDKCIVKYEDKQYNGEIVTYTVNKLISVYIRDLDKRVKVPVKDVKLINEHEKRDNVKATSTKASRPQTHPQTRDTPSTGKNNTRQKTTTERKTKDRSPKVDTTLQSKVDRFSDNTVRMSSLMGRPLDTMFNQDNLTFITEAPESEWPILNAGGGSGRVTATPQSCHIDGPPPNPLPPQLQSYNMYTSDLHLLLQELNPPVDLLKSGTPESKQQFMFELAQNSLRVYTRHLTDPALEDVIDELLCMEFEDYISMATRQEDVSLVTSLTSRDGSQIDNTPSDNVVDTPRASEDSTNTSSTDSHAPLLQSPLLPDNCPAPILHSPPPDDCPVPIVQSPPATNEPNIATPTSNVSTTTNNGATDVAINVPAPVFQHPMMFAPPSGPHPSHYSYPYMMFPGPMIPWGYYPPMGGPPYILPPQMVPPQIRGVVPTETTPTIDDQPVDDVTDKEDPVDTVVETEPTTGNTPVISNVNDAKVNGDEPEVKPSPSTSTDSNSKLTASNASNKTTTSGSTNTGGNNTKSTRSYKTSGNSNRRYINHSHHYRQTRRTGTGGGGGNSTNTKQTQKNHV